jgi:hypothetical protein
MDGSPKYLTFEGKHYGSRLIIGYLEKFLQLPSEILTLIFSSRTSVLLQAPRISKGIGKMCSEKFYQLVSMLPVNLWEIRREMKVEIVMVDETCSHLKYIAKYQGQDDDIRVTEVEGWSRRGKVVTFKEEDDWETDDDLFGLSDTANLPLFSEYRILQQRSNCIKHNPQYANERLVAKWKMDKLESIKAITDLKQVTQFLVANYTAVEFSRKIRMFNDVLDLRHLDSRVGIKAELILQMSNRVIDTEVSRLIAL